MFSSSKSDTPSESFFPSQKRRMENAARKHSQFGRTGKNTVLLMKAGYIQ